MLVQYQTQYMRTVFHNDFIGTNQRNEWTELEEPRVNEWTPVAESTNDNNRRPAFMQKPLFLPMSE